MLFNSIDFALYFLPIALFGYYAFGQLKAYKLAAGFLGLASVAFYAYWSIEHVALLLASVASNFVIGRTLSSALSGNTPRFRKTLLILGVAGNLILLGFFKYSNFLIANVAALIRVDAPVLQVVLPLGISFYTFTQIAYLVDCYRDEVRESSFAHYLLFVTYFPHLIAGPLLHHKEMMPQFRNPLSYRLDSHTLLVGTLFFAIGLFKKVVLADGIEQFATPVFDGGGARTFWYAWCGALSYTLQLYFDFSGYSDMAVGLSWMFGVRLPYNFHSPYKATNIIEFWRRWHITLSRFLRDYLYIALGGNRRGTVLRYTNLMITMLLGGLWHGAAWNFVIWGGLHGFYLCANHLWRRGIDKSKDQSCGNPSNRMATIASCAVTFLSVVVAWVFFRSKDLSSAIDILAGMAGIHGFAPLPPVHEAAPLWLAALLSIVWLSPNSQQIVGNVGRILKGDETSLTARVTVGRAASFGFLAVLIALLLLVNASHAPTEFIYYNF